MAATSLRFQLALTLPALDSGWLEAFSAGLATDARAFACPLTGGDTTKGPLAMTLTLLGAVAPERALRRSAARAGDVICVSGSLGDAARALVYLDKDSERSDSHTGQGHRDFLLNRYWLPEPRLALGQWLADLAGRGVAVSALDISDGLLQDLGHIAKASGLHAQVKVDALPISSQLQGDLGTDEQAVNAARQLALGGGDDYELCFTLPRDIWPELAQQAAQQGIRLTCIGQLFAGTGETAGTVSCVDSRGTIVTVTGRGYDHFNS